MAIPVTYFMTGSKMSAFNAFVSRHTECIAKVLFWKSYTKNEKTKQKRQIVQIINKQFE